MRLRATVSITSNSQVGRLSPDAGRESRGAWVQHKTECLCPRGVKDGSVCARVDQSERVEVLAGVPQANRQQRPRGFTRLLHVRSRQAVADRDHTWSRVMGCAGIAVMKGLGCPA